LDFVWPPPLPAALLSERLVVIARGGLFVNPWEISFFFAGMRSCWMRNIGKDRFI
jgi:hypothetical protein